MYRKRFQATLLDNIDKIFLHQVEDRCFYPFICRRLFDLYHICNNILDAIPNQLRDYGSYCALHFAGYYWKHIASRGNCTHWNFQRIKQFHIVF